MRECQNEGNEKVRQEKKDWGKRVTSVEMIEIVFIKKFRWLKCHHIAWFHQNSFGNGIERSRQYTHSWSCLSSLKPEWTFDWGERKKNHNLTYRDRQAHEIWSNVLFFSTIFTAQIYINLYCSFLFHSFDMQQFNLKLFWSIVEWMEK